MQPPLPNGLVVDRQCGAVFGQHHAKPQRSDELGIRKVDEDVADGPAFASGPVEDAGVDALYRSCDEGGTFGEVREDGFECSGHPWHAASLRPGPGARKTAVA